MALPLAEQIEKIGEVRNDIAAQLLGRQAHGETCFYLGEFVAARAVHERGIGLSGPAHRAIGAGMSFDPYAAILAHLARTLACLGYIDQARSRMDEALSEARRLRHAHTLACVLCWAGYMEQIIHSAEAQRHQEELLTLTTEHGFTFFLGFAKAQRGRSMTALGQAPEAVQLLTQALAAVSATGAVINTPTTLTWLAEAYAALGQPLEGLNCLAKAAQIIKATEERVEEADVHRVRGDLLKASGDVCGAERSYRQALAVAERQSAKLFELRSATSLARLWRDQGKRTEARELLAPIYNWFCEGFDAPDLVDARALLNGLA